jgi:hypothetical protein
MPTVSNITELKKYVEHMAKQAMNSGIAVKKTMIDTGKKHVQSDVYDVYTPKVYERTGDLKNNWKTEPTADGMAVFNDRRDEDTGKYIPDTIEYGRNYNYEFEYSNKPRPFIQNTVNELQNNNQIKEALKKDLKNVGIDSL